MQANDYDSFAEAYSADNETNLVNGHYERPAMLALAGDVRGRRVLDAGCGSGPLAAALLTRGATVTGFDSSAAMVELARQRLGEESRVHVADLGQPAILTYWHRPLHATTDAFTEAGFRVAVVSEPPVSPETPREMLPPHLEGRRSFMSLIFFVLDAN